MDSVREKCFIIYQGSPLVLRIGGTLSPFLLDHPLLLLEAPMRQKFIPSLCNKGKGATGGFRTAIRNRWFRSGSYGRVVKRFKGKSANWIRNFGRRIVSSRKEV